MSGLFSFVTKDERKKFSFRLWLDELINFKKVNIFDIISKEMYSEMKDVDYRPSKITVATIIIGLKLNGTEAKKILSDTGYSLSEYIEFDRIILESIGKRDLRATNEELMSRTQHINPGDPFLSRFTHYKSLLGTKAEKGFIILQTIKPIATADEYNEIRNMLG